MSHIRHTRSLDILTSPFDQDPGTGLESPTWVPKFSPGSGNWIRRWLHLLPLYDALFPSGRQVKFGNEIDLNPKNLSLRGALLDTANMVHGSVLRETYEDGLEEYFSGALIQTWNSIEANCTHISSYGEPGKQTLQAFLQTICFGATAVYGKCFQEVQEARRMRAGRDATR